MTILFENHKVRVTRVTAPDHAGANNRGVDRLDRLIIWLRDGLAHRKQDGHLEVLYRKRGDFVWRDASRHEVTLPHNDDHEVLIIELKPDPRMTLPTDV